MSFFRRADIAVRCVSRATTLAAPDRDALLDACEPGRRRRLQSCLARQVADAASWSVQWRKAAGDALSPNEIVAVLRCDEVVVELTYGHRGTLAALLVEAGERVAAGAQLARLERRARPAAAAEAPSNSLLRQYVARQRQDADLIASLQSELAVHQQLVGRLQREIAQLQAHRPQAGHATADAKFRRLKHAFSKHYHPDALSAGEAERLRRAHVFQEFWPIVEEIERS